jgi:hypothetical protein
MVRLGQEVLERAVAFTEGISDRPILPEEPPAGVIKTMLQPPPEEPGDLKALLDKVDKAITHAIEPGSPGMMAYVRRAAARELGLA